MTMSDEPEPVDNDRDRGDVLAATAENLNERPFSDHKVTGQVQVTALLAIYHELRHGHDQQAKQMKVLDDVNRRLGDR